MALYTWVSVFGRHVKREVVAGRYSETMNARLGRISIQVEAVGVSGESVHDGPAHAAGLVDLEAEVIVSAGDGVVVLVDDEMGSGWAPGIGVVE